MGSVLTPVGRICMQNKLAFTKWHLPNGIYQNANNVNYYYKIKGAVSRQSSSFCLILQVTRPQSLWNLK